MEKEINDYDLEIYRQTQRGEFPAPKEQDQKEQNGME